MTLESRINGLLSSWNLESPFAVALRLVMNEWRLGNNRDANTEKDIYTEKYTKERFCFTSPTRKTNHSGPSSSQTKFSYDTNNDGLPPTNIKGKCRPYSAPKKLYYASPSKKSPFENMISVTTSRNCRLNTETSDKEDSYDIISKSRLFRKALNQENGTNYELQLDDIKDEKLNVPKNVTKDVNQSPYRDVVYKDIQRSKRNYSNPSKDTRSNPNPNKDKNMGDSDLNKDTRSDLNPNKGTRNDPFPNKDNSMSESNLNKDNRSDSNPVKIPGVIGIQIKISKS